MNDGEELDNFMEQEIRASIKGLKEKKEPGADNITAEMLQGGGEHTVKMMHQLCNKIYQEEHVPVDWGRAIIVPLYKKSDKRDCGNYRGISLLSIPGKVFTKVLQQRLKRYVESCLTEEQAGFRLGKAPWTSSL